MPADRGRTGPPRVLHVTQPVDGGVARVVLDLVRAQTAGPDPAARVTVACPADGPLAGAVTRAGADWLDWPATRSPGPGLRREVRSLARLLETVRPDLVHAHSAKAGLVVRLALRGRTPTVFQPHAWSFEAVGGPLAALSRRWERYGARWAHRIVCVSEAERRTGAAAGVPGRWAVVPNGVDTDRFRPGGGSGAPGPVPGLVSVPGLVAGSVAGQVPGLVGGSAAGPLVGGNAAGAVPGPVPGSGLPAGAAGGALGSEHASGAVRGSVPGSGAVPGAVPGSVPGAGSVPGPGPGSGSGPGFGNGVVAGSVPLPGPSASPSSSPAPVPAPGAVGDHGDGDHPGDGDGAAGGGCGRDGGARERGAARRSLAALAQVPPDAPLVVCVARLCRQKGQDVLLRAWPGIARAVPGARLVLVGDGPDRSALRAAAPERVIFTGPVDDPRPWYRAADLVVLPSRWEGMALAPLEAMACGRPVLLTEVDGARESLPPEHAPYCLVPPGDPGALARATAGLLLDAERRAALGRAGRRHVLTTHDVRHSARAVAAVYRELLGAERTQCRESITS